MILIKIGQIVKPQGLKGEVKLKSFADFNVNFDNLDYVYFNENDKRKLVSSRKMGDFAYFGIEGITSRTQAESLRGQNLFIEETMAEKDLGLKEGRYFIKDVIDCKVVDEEQNIIGTVSKIDQFGSADIYTLKTDKNEILFPLTDDVVKKFDIENKQIIVNKKRFYEVCTYDD